jgi:hypothetical protein
MIARRETDAEWGARRVAPLPARWQTLLLDPWRAQLATGDTYGANSRLRVLTDSLVAVRIPLDASDSTIVQEAEALAERCAERATLYHDAASLYAAQARIARGQGIEPPQVKDDKWGPSIARLCCPLWWRRKLRRHHGQTFEAAAIALGHVNRKAGIYCSHETLHRRLAQNERNRLALENTVAENDLGQEYTLAELAAKGPGNKAIRRAELMTRIAGFERIARDCGHAGLFMTLTCPSRFHKARIVAGWKVIDNPNHEPACTPKAGQQYLAKVWSRIRAALARRGVKLYGFRIAEPQHDGTPHWHFLVFHDPAHAAMVREMVTHYALQDTPGELGAAQHRADFKAIDWERGTAAGYIAKYVSKNIDGYRVEKDLYGNDALASSARVEAWASTWAIRQFQQVGGPPVGVWRELRRVAAIPAGAPEWLQEAHRAVNKLANLEGGQDTPVAWDRYCKAQGGVFVGRNARIKLTQVTPDKLGRYGDEASPRPVGVETTASELYHVLPGLLSQRLVLWQVPSERREWTIKRRRGGAQVQPARPSGVPVWEFTAERAQPAEPWTRVNNCTEGVEFGNETDDGAAEGGARGGSGCQSDDSQDGRARCPADHRIGIGDRAAAGAGRGGAAHPARGAMPLRAVAC